MKKIVLLLLLFVGINLQADTLKEGYTACTSEELFFRCVKAINQHDETDFRYLMNKHKCIITPAREVKLLSKYTKKVPDIGIIDIAKVRLYIGDKSLDIWSFGDVVE